MKDQRLDRTVRDRYKLDLRSDLRDEEARVSALNALVHHGDGRLPGALRGQTITGLTIVIPKVGVSSYMPTNFADSVWVIGIGLRYEARTTHASQQGDRRTRKQNRSRRLEDPHQTRGDLSLG